MDESTLVATLGGQAQVVTFALDWLLDQGMCIDELVVLHLSPGDARHHHAVTQLLAEFRGDRYQGQACRLRLAPVRWPESGRSEPGQPRGAAAVPVGAGNRLDDIRDEAGAEAVWQAAYALVGGLKAQGRRLDLCVAGGRRMMGLLTMSAAMLLCDHQDRVWHMYTPPEFLERARDGAILHAGPEDGVRLVRVPVLPWGAYVPALRQLAQPASGVIRAHTEWLDAGERSRCRQVWERLTDRQRDLLVLLAEGHNPQSAAEQMCITLNTVNSHKTVILAECRVAWNLAEDAGLSYHFVRDRFGRYTDWRS